MKYTKYQFDRIIKCFDSTIEMAKVLGNSTFNCLPLYNDNFEAIREPCKKYCPAYGSGLIRECFTHHDAAYWQFAKEKFIIENEPEGSEDI